MRQHFITMTQKVTLYLALIFGMFIMAGCTEESEYESMVREGLNSEEKHNNLFLGYTLGMTREDFLSTSWEMNQQQIITGGVKIVYLLEDLKSTARMEFFPEFNNGVIVKLPVNVTYVAWSPWNEQYNPEELLVDMREYFEEFFETIFTEVYIPEIEKKALVSIEGNREIRMYKYSSNTVQVDFIDLSHFHQNLQ